MYDYRVFITPSENGKTLEESNRDIQYRFPQIELV